MSQIILFKEKKNFIKCKCGFCGKTFCKKCHTKYHKKQGYTKKKK